MSAITIDERSALVLIDLQQGILALPTLIDPDDIKILASCPVHWRRQGCHHRTRMTAGQVDRPDANGSWHLEMTRARSEGTGPDSTYLMAPDLFTGRCAPDREAVPAGHRSEFAATARIIAAADEARRRIERDLHDGLQQRLMSLLLRAALAEASIPGDQQELKGELARIADGLLEVVETVREVSRGIHPAILSEGGLGPAVEALARGSLMPVTLHSSVVGRLPGRVEVGAYYIISEALANAAKHAKATAVDISVGHRGHALDLSVRDDGIGGADGSGPGLTGLADRVHALAGTMQLISPRGHGTQLRVSLPTGPGQPD